MYKSLILIVLLSGSIVALSAAESKAALSFSGGGFTTTPAQCQDGKNNSDNDTLVDYGKDPDCTSLTDNSEKASTSSLTISAMTLTVSSSTPAFDVLCNNDGTGTDCPRSVECSAFGKQAKGGTVFTNELQCDLTNAVLGVRCVNNGGGSTEANFHSAHVPDGALISTSFVQILDSKGKWSGITEIAGSDIYFLAKQLFPDSSVCPNEQNWTVDWQQATILQADVVETTLQNGVCQNVLDLGTCVLTDFVSGTYSCSTPTTGTCQ